MNERIRELSDIAYKNHLARNPHSSFGRRSDYDRELAELIVRQCADISNQAEKQCQHPGTQILKHFGVD
jgi:hypothetical protein